MVVQHCLSVPSAVGALQHLRIGAVCRLTPLKPFKYSKVRITMAMPPWLTRQENISMLESRHLTLFQRRKILLLLTDAFVGCWFCCAVVFVTLLWCGHHCDVVVHVVRWFLVHVVIVIV